MENSKSGLELSNGTVKLDIYQHLKIGVQNQEKNCACDNSIENKYYCIHCKISCCEKCTLDEHKTHLLIAKGNFEIETSRIDKSFKELDDILEKDELYSNIDKKKEELINEVIQTHNELLKMIDEWKNKKINEINELLDELTSSIKNINQKKNESKTALNNFAKKNKSFLSLNNSKNKDQNNTIFLINYDILNISYLWSSNIAKIALSLKSEIDEYKIREKAKNKNIINDVYNILFNNEDEDPETREKLDEKFLPLFKIKIEIKELNTDKLKEINKRIAKFNKGVESFKQNVMNSINKNGNYKDIEKENSIFEHRKIKGADNLFSQRKLDLNHGENSNSIIPNKQIKTKNDIELDNQIINKYFTHILTDIYDQYFRIPTIELQSSHADLKLKADTSNQDDTNFAKVIEGTDKVMLFDKKTCKLTKKKLIYKKILMDILNFLWDVGGF